METSFILYCQLGDKTIRNHVINIMTRGKRPDFDDEVPESMRKVFRVLEYTEYSDHISKQDGVILFQWDLLNSQSVKDIPKICYGLEVAKASDIIGFFADDEETDMFVIWNKGRLHTIINIEEQVVQNFNENYNNSQSTVSIFQNVKSKISNGQYKLGNPIYL